MQYAYVESQYCWIPFKLTNILQNKLWSYHRLRIVLDRTFVSRTSNLKLQTPFRNLQKAQTSNLFWQKWSELRSKSGKKLIRTFLIPGSVTKIELLPKLSKNSEFQTYELGSSKAWLVQTLVENEKCMHLMFK